MSAMANQPSQGRGTLEVERVAGAGDDLQSRVRQSREHGLSVLDVSPVELAGDEQGGVAERIKHAPGVSHGPSSDVFQAQRETLRVACAAPT